VAAWLDELAHESLASQQKRLLEIEAEAGEVAGGAGPEAAALVSRVTADRERVWEPYVRLKQGSESATGASAIPNSSVSEFCEK